MAWGRRGKDMDDVGKRGSGGGKDRKRARCNVVMFGRAHVMKHATDLTLDLLQVLPKFSGDLCRLPFIARWALSDGWLGHGGKNLRNVWI